MKKVILLGMICLSLNSQALTQRIEVLGMVCAFCAQGIEKSFESAKNVKAVFVNLEDYFVAIESKNEKGLDEMVIRKIITESGYDVKKIEVVPDSVSVIKKKYEPK
jgi:cation transport ATPase